MPEVTFTPDSSFCSLGVSPYLLTGILRDWLVNHFSAAERIEEPALRKRVWLPEAPGSPKSAPDTGIIIEDVLTWEPTTTEKRPGILVSRNDWNDQPFGINSGNIGQADKYGNEHYTVGIVGSHTLFCVAGKGPEAEVLAGEVARELRRFGPVVRRELDRWILRFGVAGIGKPFKIEEARESFGVPVTVAYGMQDTWVLMPQSTPLRQIVLNLFANLAA